MHAGHVLREVCKCAGSPDPHHRTRPERPVPYPESTANAQGHRTQITRRALSIQCSQPKTPAEDRQHRTHKQELSCIRCLTLTEPNTTAHQMRRLCVRCLHGLRPALPRLLQTSHRRNRKYAFHFLKSAKSHLASSAGGIEEPKPLSTLQPPPPSQSVTTPSSVHCWRFLSINFNYQINKEKDKYTNNT